ncbi:MAG: apolipoprotein N-acyltransferase [Spirochaetales bacterium]|nr:apolipoprotein N-acyltransferase [Spirochaetales bacterium]
MRNFKKLLPGFAGIVFISVALAEWVLSLFGPFVFNEKINLLIFPFYTYKLSDDEQTKIKGYLRDSFTGSERYLVMDENSVEKKLKMENLSLSDFKKTRTHEKARELSRKAQAGQYIMGYVMKSGGEYEILVNLSDSKFDTEIKVIKQKFTSFDGLLHYDKTIVEELSSLQKGFSIAEITYIPILVCFFIYGSILLLIFFLPSGTGRIKLFTLFRGPEILFCLSLLFFLFAFIFSLNANMDYVQRFIATGGNIGLAADSGKEQMNVFIRFAPLLLIALGAYIAFRILFRKSFSRYSGGKGIIRRWALGWVFVSSIATFLAFPSFIAQEGLGCFALICLVPVILVFFNNRYGASLFYGTVYGTISFLLINYWLGTFSLISLQFVVIFYIFFFLVLMGIMLYPVKKFKILTLVIIPLSWVGFDFLRSIGFLGYPWGMLGTTLYGFHPLIQISAVTGVWGVTFLAVLCNAILAYAIYYFLKGENMKALVPVCAGAAIFAGVLFFGFNAINNHDEKYVLNASTSQVKIALVQESLDPRKHADTEVYSALIRLTDGVMNEKPDMVVWSEGAFDWDIRQFTDRSGDAVSDSRVVRDFLLYQKAMNACLVTGIVDQEPGPEGEKKYYNSAILLNKKGDIAGIYHKKHLVPFTEHFPYRKELPWVFDLLKGFDVFFWTAGEKETIFDQGEFRFFTPICFEDSFPGEIRDFVNKGAGMIVNISNDFWSQTPVEARQHTINSLFRAVENGLPMVRATTSGVTCYVDRCGRILASLPCYEEGTLVVSVPTGTGSPTPYTRWGDWFPLACLTALAGFLITVLLLDIIKGRSRRI